MVNVLIRLAQMLSVQSIKDQMNLKQLGQLILVGAIFTVLTGIGFTLALVGSNATAIFGAVLAPTIAGVCAQAALAVLHLRDGAIHVPLPPLDLNPGMIPPAPVPPLPCPNPPGAVLPGLGDLADIDGSA